jgi:hypothetical protein
MMFSLGISNDMSTEMMCEVMKTMFSEDTRERSDSLKPCRELVKMKMLSYHLKIDRCYIDERAIGGLV